MPENYDRGGLPRQYSSRYGSARPNAFMLAANGETIREHARLPPIARADLATL
jgi:hypothetical protein